MLKKKAQTLPPPTPTLKKFSRGVFYQLEEVRETALTGCRRVRKTLRRPDRGSGAAAVSRVGVARAAGIRGCECESGEALLSHPQVVVFVAKGVCLLSLFLWWSRLFLGTLSFLFVFLRVQDLSLFPIAQCSAGGRVELVRRGCAAASVQGGGDMTAL